ncbi:MAG: transglycosylase SLT domain-containing protein [Candidatus Omnitrophica bacterium]|nr:transglycosylase SLT domain-containing protein [Candidatus Omnitrophota bacterium]
MPKSDVDVWLERETPRIRRALESASRYFDANDDLTVNTLEAVYGRESSFGTLLGKRGSTRAAGHFQFEPATAKRYDLNVSKKSDQRFDIDRVSSAAARYLKDLHTMFGRDTGLPGGKRTIAVTSASERKKFVLGAYNAGEGRVAGAQRLAEQAGKNPRLWGDVQQFIALAGTTKAKEQETKEYVENILRYEAEFAIKSPADKRRKQKQPGKRQDWCTEGHWRTIDDRPVFICD